MRAILALLAILLGARLATPLPASDAGRTHETVALIDLRELPAQDWTR